MNGSAPIRMLDVAEAAALVGLSSKVLRLHLRSGDLKAHPPSGARGWRIELPDLLAWMNRQATSPTAVDLEATDPKFINVEQLAETLNITSGLAIELVRSGDLKAVKVGAGGQWRIDTSAFEDWIQQQYLATRAFVDANPLGVKPGNSESRSLD